MTQRHGDIVYLTAGNGRAFWGPGDLYTFLVTGDQSGGAYFMMEAWVPPGGGPPPHVHRREDETFYIVEGQCSILLGDRTVTARAGDFVNIPRGTVHGFRNEGTGAMRMVLTFSPSGIEKFFEETLEPAQDRTAMPPQNIQAVLDRYVAAAPKYGIEFIPLARDASAPGL